jgi:C4-dicarboxylate transporter
MLTAQVFVPPPPGPVTVALICSLLGQRMTAARVPAALVGAALLGVLTNHGPVVPGAGAAVLASPLSVLGSSGTRVAFGAIECGPRLPRRFFRPPAFNAM